MFFLAVTLSRLPIDNSTAECLAEYICAELTTMLDQYDISHLHTIMVGVEEAPTQMAYYRMITPALQGVIFAMRLAAESRRDYGFQ